MIDPLFSRLDRSPLRLVKPHTVEWGREGEIMNYFATLAIILCLAGCVVPTQAALDARMSGFLGRPEVDVIMALGVPARSAEAGGLRFIEYEHRRIVGWPAVPWSWGSPSLGDYVETRECRITFTLRDGRVVHFDSRGNDCATLF